MNFFQYVGRNLVPRVLSPSLIWSRVRLCTRVSLAILIFGWGSNVVLGGQWQFGPDLPMPEQRMNAAKDALGRIYLAGHDSPTPSTAVYRFDEKVGTWETITQLANARADRPGVASDHLGRIYVMGADASGTVERYDPIADSWTFVAPMTSPRSNMRSVTDSTGKIYVVGGNPSGGGNPLATFERYDPLTDTWSGLPSMAVPRATFGLAIDSFDRIYALGGIIDSGGTDTDTVERYDPGTGSWSFVDSLNSARQIGVAIADCEDFVYAIGGWEPGYSCKVERFNPVSELWEDFDPINQCRNNIAGILANSGRLYIFGGDAGFASQSTVEFLPLPPCLWQKIVPADFDFDGDVDGVDFSKFASCFNKAGNPPRTLGCTD